MNFLDRFPYQEDLRILWSVFPDARLVGGVVRDGLLGQSCADIDMATPETPDMIIQKLQDAGIKAIPTGIAHGTITAILNHHAFEITTLRKDVQTDGRHARVAWTDSWQEDAARRDFTINAMYCDKNGKIWDFFEGREDLATGRLRFVGDAHQRIGEDLLRILRFFRFYGRYGRHPVESSTVSAIKENMVHLDQLSAERIWSEFQKILTGPNAEIVLSMMDHYGILRFLMPSGYDLTLFKAMIKENAPAESILRLAALMSGKVKDIARFFKLSRKQEQQLLVLKQRLPLSHLFSEADLMRLKAEISMDILIGKSWLAQAQDGHAQSWQEWRECLKSIPQPLFPVMGQDLLEAGVKAGPEIGRYLKAVRNWWLVQGCQANKTECMAWLKHHIDCGMVNN